MCTTSKVTTITSSGNSEVIKTATQADASTQKANAENRTGVKGVVSENIRTSNNGVDEEIISSKKKLLGE